MNALNNGRKACANFDEVLVRYVDGEATEEEVQTLREHVAECERCREELRAHQKLRDLAQDLGRVEPPEELWDEYVQGVYNRMERSFGWVFVVAGGLLLALVGAWRYVTRFLLDRDVGVLAKVGLTVLIVGLAALLLSVYRQRRREARTDRYKEIVR